MSDERVAEIAATSVPAHAFPGERECRCSLCSSITLAREVRELREFAERVVSLCPWGPTAWIGEDEEEIQDAGSRLGVFVERPHPQPCTVDGCECDGSPTLLHFAWRAPPPAPARER